jgi:hypothetical protein
VRGVRAVLALLAVVTCAALNSCTPGRPDSAASAAASATPTATPVESLGGCLGPPRASVSTLSLGSMVLRFAVIGQGRTGVIIAYENRGTVCTWLPLADTLVTAGLRVVLFDYSGRRDGEDVATLAAQLRRMGVDRVFLVGGSLGGAEVLAGAVAITPPVAGVVNISGGLPDGVTLAGRLRVPLLQVVSRQDAVLISLRQDPVGWISQINRAARQVPDKKMVVVDGSEHASELFTGPNAGTVDAAILHFIAGHQG